MTRIVGGLGNQMFQYAVGRSLSLRSGQQLKIDLTEMRRYKLRSMQLDQFNIVSEIAAENEVPARPRNSVFGKLVTAIKNRNRIDSISEKGNSFDPSILEVSGSAHLVGYWQTEKYFVDHADVIRQDFSLKQPFSAQRQMTYAAIQKAKSSISVHVRRGDYVTNPTANAIHGTCDPEWYQRAMKKMSQVVEGAVFFVFSDDPEWARANLPAFDRMVFIEPQSDERDGEDMHLMASCRSHIIANSTFSWWGAWLNPREDKCVIAPARWFRSDEHDDRDLVPDEWNRI